MRRWNLADERIYRLAWGHSSHGVGFRASPAVSPLYREDWQPNEKEVSFVNKATGELLSFEYLGVEFADWAPGWGFLLLGKRLHPPVEGET